MKQINVLMVVDVENALASGNLTDNIYLIDSNKHFGSGAEGQAELVTACNDGQIIIWSVAPVDPGTDVNIVSFSGQIIDDKICTPRQTELPGGAEVWSGRVESQGASNTWQYNCTLSMDGKSLTFDPYLKVSAD